MNLSFLNGFEFFTGVPDSLLQPMCSFLVEKYGVSGPHHVIAANEGNAVGLAAGYHLATGKIPVVYLQNSGIGNIINPVTSLLSEDVYGIPCLFIVGWRGEPGIHDEPQHVFMGKATPALLCAAGLEIFTIKKEMHSEEVLQVLRGWEPLFAAGKSAALIVEKGALSHDGNPEYKNANTLQREDIIRSLLPAMGEDIIVSTTGKTSRELFELRAAAGQTHARDFLTVGSMGHASSIALGIALAKPKKRIWVLDGDGAALMHLGAMAVIGARKLQNIIHVVINNEAHESVGGLPTIAGQIDLSGIAKCCGYHSVFTARDAEELKDTLEKLSECEGSVFLEVRSAIGSRSDLGRPTLGTKDNKIAFMENLQ